MKQCDCCGKYRRTVVVVCAFGLETAACATCRGHAEEDTENMPAPILTSRAREAILSAEQDIYDAVRETDDLITCAALGDVVKELHRILDWAEDLIP